MALDKVLDTARIILQCPYFLDRKMSKFKIHLRRHHLASPTKSYAEQVITAYCNRGIRNANFIGLELFQQAVRLEPEQVCCNCMNIVNRQFYGEDALEQYECAMGLELLKIQSK